MVNSKLSSMRAFLDKNKVKKQGFFKNLTFLLVVNSLLYTRQNLIFVFRFRLYMFHKSTLLYLIVEGEGEYNSLNFSRLATHPYNKNEQKYIAIQINKEMVIDCKYRKLHIYRMLVRVSWE